MRASFIAIVLALATIACGSSEGSTAPGERPRGPFGGPPAEPVATPVAAPTPSPSARRRPERDVFGHADLTTGGGSGTITTTERVEVPGTPGEAPERDLAADLATAIGSVAGCVDLETARALHGHLRIRVAATVMATGSVTRATATGPSLPPEALACVQARALAAHLASPVEGAPRTVTAQLEYEVTTTEDTRTTTTPEFATRPGAVAPGIVTPAIGPDGPVEGRVAPSSTLPATTGGTGRPEGSVAPDIVLPARQ